MPSKKLIIIITLMVIVAGLGTGGFICVYTQTNEFDQVYRDGVYIEDIDLSGLTKEAAKTKVTKMVQSKKEAKEIILHGDDKQWTIPYTEFKGSYNIDVVLDEAFQVGHEGSRYDRFKEFTKKEVEKIVFTLDRSYNKEIADDIIKEYAEAFYVAPKDATMVRKDKKFLITPEQPGQELDTKTTAEGLRSLYEAGEQGKVEVVINTLEPKRTSSYYNDVQTPIASFHTTFTNRDPDRNVNLKVGAETINTSIEPGATFALSDYFGIISSENGYKNSKVIVNGKLVDGVGGGICQVASTLYNSVLLTDLKVTSRQNHSLPVGYIPLGRDATYASGVIDFKFENPTEYPAYVESYLENNRLYVNIFGHQSLKPDTDIKFESVIKEVIPAPAPKYEKDPDLAKGKEVQILAPLEGKKVDLYKYTYKDGKLIDKVLENQSYYRPRAAIISVGTKEIEVPPVVEVPEVMPKETPKKVPEDVPKETSKEPIKEVLEEAPKKETKPPVKEEASNTSFFKPQS